jgi:hypothetical protein
LVLEIVLPIFQKTVVLNHIRRLWRIGHNSLWGHIEELR